MKKILALLGAACAVTASAVTPLWMRDAAISPDGSQIAFTYKGDIYKVPSCGGEAVRLTAQPGMEMNPVWSPDGGQIAFADDRNGNLDVYVMPAAGGEARRLTSNSTSEIPEAFSPDGKWVYYSACIQDPATSAQFPNRRLTEVYRVPADGGRPEQVIAAAAQSIAFLPDGGFVYNDAKGMENAWRKHHTSSITRDIWRYDAKSGAYTNLTSRGGEDRNPVVAPNGETVYFLSERDGGSMNVYSFSLGDPANVKAVSSFADHPVRFLSMSRDGQLAYTYDGELYTQIPGQQPQKVNVTLTTDAAEAPTIVSIASGNSEYAVSPNGEQIAVINRGDIFVGSVEYSSVRQVTDTPAVEKHLSWHPNNRSLVYVSERDGHWNIYKATIGRKDDPNFSNATVINEKALFDGKDGIERTYPQYSPDGSKLAFIQDRSKLMMMDVNSGAVKQLTDGSTWCDRSGGFRYEWSPDSRLIALEVVDRKHDPYTDIAVLDTDTGEIINLTGTAYFDEDPHWALDGNAILFTSDRLGMRSQASWGSQQDAYLIFMNRDAYDRFRLNEEDYELLKDVEKQQAAAKKKAEDEKTKGNKKDKKKGKKDKDEESADDEKPEDYINLEPDGITDRIVRLTPNSSDIASALVSGDGKTLYYLSKFEKGYDLWKIDLRDKSVSLVKKLNARSMAMMPDAKGKAIYLLGSSSMKKLDPKNDKLTDITISGNHRIDPVKEREAMFNQVVFQEREMFYDPAMHGVDWDALTARYREFLPHINNNHDFAEMLSELLGELNVSHTGSGYSGGSTNYDPTASLGLLYDMSYTGDGLKVDEIVAGGPFDRASSRLAPGCIIEKINGKKITADADETLLLSNIAKKKTLVSIFNPANGERWDEVVLPITASAMNELMYQRWVRQREADVDRLSGGRLGYVHIRSMNDASFRPIYADILGKFNDREGIVIDVRYNGGGRMHEDIEILFSGQQYLTQVVRGKETCVMPSRRWTKPSIMLVCEACYSNAHGTPWVYKHQGLGKIVGTPVPGTMTSVNWITLQDPSLYFGVPVVGYRTAEGNYLENTQLEPDVYVTNDPAALAAGQDDQLKAAVETLLKQIDGK